MKKEINRTLGNSLRCILPSFWWKRLLGKMVDKIESAEESAAAASRIAMLAGFEASDKQDRLVSGSNIKTINNQSILGSGNITIEASDKQDRLVSGSNIKTINNQSILGSGNITIEADGGVEQIIFYATENDAYPLTDAQIAHNVESMQKQRTAFLNDTPVSFLVSVNSDVHQLCEPAAFYSPSNNTAIPVLFYIMGGGYYQFAVTCNWDGTATVEDVKWIDAELSDTSKNPVQNKVVTKAIEENEKVHAAAYNDLNARLQALEAALSTLSNPQ